MNTPLRDPNDLERERLQIAAQQALSGPPLVDTRTWQCWCHRRIRMSTPASRTVARLPASALGEERPQRASHSQRSTSSPMTTSKSCSPTPKSSSRICLHRSITLTRLCGRLRCNCAECGKPISADCTPISQGMLLVLTGLSWPTMTSESESPRRPPRRQHAKLMKEWAVASEEMDKLAKRSERASFARWLTGRRSSTRRTTRIEAEHRRGRRRYASSENRSGGLSSLLTEPSRRRCVDFLVGSIRDGQGPKEIGDGIQAHFESTPSTRADRVARSETRDAVNAATLLSGQAAGIRYVRASDGEDFDEECARRNGRLFTIREAWKELRKEHPTAPWASTSFRERTSRSSMWKRCQKQHPPTQLPTSMRTAETAFIVFNSDGTDEYLSHLGAWLVNQNGHKVEA